MLYSILTPIVVFRLSLGSSYFITRPIGDIRRHIAAVVISLACGVIGGVVAANMIVPVCVALGATVIGMMIAWRRRNRLTKPQGQSKPRHQRARRSHYHGISRA
jgi:uncharacterized iron-regulated membrane protein